MSEPGHLADAVLDGLLGRDPALLRTRLHPRVHLRMLQPGSTVARVRAHPVAAGRRPGSSRAGSCTASTYRPPAC